LHPFSLSGLKLRKPNRELIRPVRFRLRDPLNHAAKIDRVQQALLLASLYRFQDMLHSACEARDAEKLVAKSFGLTGVWNDRDVPPSKRYSAQYRSSSK
jgi:hypothetical protein